MIHRDDEVEFSGRRPREHRIGWQRAAHVESVGAYGRNRRPDLAILFAAEESVLARMRIETGDRDARLFNAQVAACAIAQPDTFDNARRPNAIDRLAQ